MLAGGLEAVLALETLVVLVLFLPLSEECLFPSQSDSDNLYQRTAARLYRTHSKCVWLHISPVFIYMHTEITFMLQSRWGRFALSARLQSDHSGDLE